MAPAGNSSIGTEKMASSSSSTNRRYCHQCRQKRNVFLSCKAMKEDKPCKLAFCHKCLSNRYEENANNVESTEEWSCPKWRGICNCSICTTKAGLTPTGKKRPDREMVAANVTSLELIGEDNAFDENVDANLVNAIDEQSENLVNTYDEKRIKSKKAKLEGSNEQQDIDSLEEISFPVGSEVTSVAGIDICSKDIGNALQFSKFCDVFGKFLDIETGQAEHVLRDIFHGQTGQTGEYSATVKFYIPLLAILRDDQTRSYPDVIPSVQDSWFDELKVSLSKSESVLRANGLEFLDSVDDYKSLDVTQKLILLNIFCDEVVLTEKVRTWMNDEHEIHSESVGRLKKNVADLKDEEKQLKEKMKADIAAATFAKNGAVLSTFEHDAIVSSIKPEIEKAHAKVLESKSNLEKRKNRKADALRLEPVLKSGGKYYWKLNPSDETHVLCQNVGNGKGEDSLNEEWTIMGDEGKNMIEKHVCSFRGRRSRTLRSKKTA